MIAVNISGIRYERHEGYWTSSARGANCCTGGNDSVGIVVPTSKVSLLEKEAKRLGLISEIQSLHSEENVRGKGKRQKRPKSSSQIDMIDISLDID
jgi:hypothetical protein